MEGHHRRPHHNVVQYSQLQQSPLLALDSILYYVVSVFILPLISRPSSLTSTPSNTTLRNTTIFFGETRLGFRYDFCFVDLRRLHCQHLPPNFKRKRCVVASKALHFAARLFQQSSNGIWERGHEKGILHRVRILGQGFKSSFSYLDECSIHIHTGSH